jgi:hypothetical protein
MASLASLNPFAAEEDNSNREGNNRREVQSQTINQKINNPFASNLNNGGIIYSNNSDSRFGNGSPKKNIHIDHLSDFDPLAKSSPKNIRKEDIDISFDVDDDRNKTNVPNESLSTSGSNDEYKLNKTYSCEDDLQKLSMLVHRGTLNEAEKMVARELIMERTPGISFAISSAICKNKQQLLKLIAMHQGGQFHAISNGSSNDSNSWADNSSNSELDIFKENNIESDIFSGDNNNYTNASKNNQELKNVNNNNNFPTSFDHKKWKNNNQMVESDNWFKSDNNTSSQPNSVAMHANYIQSPTHNIKRVDPQTLSARHIDYDKFKTTNTGALVGMIMQRVTSKKILKKWSPRYFVLTKNALLLYKEVWEYTKGMQPKLEIPLHRLMLISDVYVFTKEDALQGPRRAYQFKIIENKLSAHYSTMHYQQFSRQLPSTEICKLGHVDQKAATVLRTEIVKIVLDKQNNAGASVGRQVVSGRYE